jgi:xylulokinase
MGELVLGIDIGTASSKGLLARPDGTIVAVSQRPHPLSLPRPGWAEHDAEDVWWADFQAICADLVSQADGEIVGVCTSGIGACFLPADSEGRPLRPAILYGIDTRATREIAELTERYGDLAILERGGTLLTSQAVGPKLLWLQRNEPEVWSQTRQLLMASSFLVRRLTGEYMLDYHSASQCDPLYDVTRNTWNEEWAAEIAPGLPLPRLVWPGEAAGRVTAEAALATGLPAGTPVAAGTIDAWVEALSVDVRAPGDLMLMYGSTMMLIEVVDSLKPYPGLWGTPGVFRGTSTLAAGMSTSGILTGWFKDLVHGGSFEELVREAAAVPPGADGLVVLPYFAGERCPMADPLARGLICGLALHHGRGHLYRALLESTAYGVRHNVESLREAGATQRRVVAVGGGTRGGLWTQIVSDVTGRPQEIPRETIGASYGDALLAAIAAGLVGPETRWNGVADVVEPREESREVYDTLYRVYRELYPSTREQMHVLAELQLAAAANVRRE